ncbi:MAG TPA: hypothetical protein VIE89_06375 [Candidatus Binatia bacterium]|jgi:hypothetical protein
MPEPHEDMESVRKFLTATGSDKIFKAELKERWLGENRGKSVKEYYEFYQTQEFGGWQDFFKGKFDNSFERFAAEETFVPEINTLDGTLKLGSGLFADKASEGVYKALTRDLSSDNLSESSYDSVYRFNSASMSEFKLLLADARKGAQRNAAELGTELVAALSLASDEVLRETGDPSIWQNSELKVSLEELRTTLNDWDQLLATGALPDKDRLINLMREVDEKLAVCDRKHREIMVFRNKKEAVPFVKYQLLATMRALGEKVASQFAARAGKGSFTGMYELIRDVPGRGRGAEGLSKAQDLVRDYQGDLTRAWLKELEKLENELVDEDRKLAKELNGEFKKLTRGKTAIDVGKAITTWRECFADPMKLKTNVGESRNAIAEIAFGLRKYKEVADGVLMKSAKPAVKAIRGRYQATFDGFVRQIERDIVQCIAILKQ